MKSLLLVLTVVLVGCGGGTQEAATNDSNSGTLGQTGDTKTCYWCKESIKAAALICKHCCSNDPDHRPFIADPIVEKAIRKELKKPTGELTKADLEKVTKLDLSSNQLASVKGLEKLTQLTDLRLNGNQLTDVTGLEKLTKLKVLGLANNPALTKAQIAELQKALPKCKIESNPTK